MARALDFSWPIIGHDKIKKFLQNNLTKGNLAQAYLFSGPDGLGKKTLARVFAQSILCENYRQAAGPVPCGQCETCRQFQNNVYADMYWVERELNEKTEQKKNTIAVTQIRELLASLSHRAFLNFYKIVIIPEAEALSEEASNCLLKTLEEPTLRTIIILIAPNTESLLPTILSRCQILKFAPINKEEIYKYVLEAGAPRSLALEMASASQGRLSKAKQWLTEGDEIKGLQARLRGWLQMLSAKPVARFKFVENWLNSSPDADEVLGRLTELAGLARDVLLLQTYIQDLVSYPALIPEMQAPAQKFSPERWIGFLRQIENTRMYIKQNVNPRLALENLLLNI